jgi:hypothetical protein
VNITRRQVGVASLAAVLLPAAVACAGAKSAAPVSTIFGTNRTPTTTPTTIVETTTTAEPTTTTEAPTTTAEPTTTTEAPTTTAAPTTTTEPPGASLPLRFDGVGDARFGLNPDDVLQTISKVLGRTTADTNWVKASDLDCDGTEARQVFFNDLKLTFGDESDEGSGFRHFFAWQFGPPAGSAPNPKGMATVLGVTIGTNVADLRKAYPSMKLIEEDATHDPGAQLAKGLSVVLTDTTESGVVTQLNGGTGCR